MTAPAEVRRAISSVVDPCSNAIGVPLDLDEMGLVTEVEVDQIHGEVSVTLCLTSACCTYGPTMAEALTAELQAIDWVCSATVRIDHAVVWTPDRLSPEGRQTLESRRRRALSLTDTSPYDWSDTWLDRPTR